MVAFVCHFINLRYSCFIQSGALASKTTSRCWVLPRRSRNKYTIVQARQGNKTDPSSQSSTEPSGLKENTKNIIAEVKSRPKFYASIALLSGALLTVYTILNAILSVLNRIPLIPNFLELIGIAYSMWFVWRYLVFAESRDDLVQDFKSFLGKGSRSD